MPTLAAAGQAAGSRSAEESPILEAQGHEHLTWDQDASSREELAAFRFVAYVDGRRQALPSVSCGAGTESGWFKCAAPLPFLGPGVHVIEVAANAVTGLRGEGLRSAPIRVRIGPAATSTSVAAPMEASGDALPLDHTPSTDRQPAPSADGVRLRATELASGLDDPTDVLPLPDGRVLIAERAGRVRMFHDGALLANAAATFDEVTVGDGRGLLALAADRAFPETGHVFAVYTTDDGLRVVRLRVFGDALVDRSILLEGLPVSAVQPAALLRSGPDGRLYLALDNGGDPRSLDDMGSYSGKVLRFGTDGTPPDDQPGRSPVWSVGVAHPVGLAWSAENGTLRLVGVERPTDARVQPSPTRSDPGEITRFSLPPDAGASRAAIVAGPSFPALRGNLLVASTVARAVLRVWFTAGDRPVGSEWLLSDLPGPVTALAFGADGSIYATVGRALFRIVEEP